MDEFRRGVIMGCALWAFTSFGAFHILNATGVIEDELAWGILQGTTAAVLWAATIFSRGRL